MKVKELLEIISYEVIDYAKIYEMIWNEDYQDYDTKFTDKRVKSKKDLEPYFDYELDFLEYKTLWGEYDDSSIYIKIPKEIKTIKISF